MATTIYGDPLLNPTLSGKLHGKNQTLVGIDNQDNALVGDVHAEIEKRKAHDSDTDLDACIWEVESLLLG